MFGLAFYIEANKVADKAANHGKENHLLFQTFDSPPHFVLDELLYDVNDQKESRLVGELCTDIFIILT